jgi:hypothetical protein
VAEDSRSFPLLTSGESLAYEREYRDWLGARGTKGRTLGDLVSRTKRAATLANILAPGTDAEVIFRLTQDPRFALLTPNVKSQLKRAVGLYRKFHRERRGT